MAQTHRKLCQPTPQDVQRFWKKVNKEGPIPTHRPELGPCWIWTAGLTRNQYGQFYYHGTPQHAQRVAYRIAYNTDPAEFNVLHHCDNPPCQNPGHLFLGTQADNMQDKVNKGRVSRTHHSNLSCGEDRINSKLTTKDVLRIRTSLDPTANLARELLVSYATVWDIRQGKTWRHLLSLSATPHPDAPDRSANSEQ